jgi:hypothetical protein
MKPSRINFSQDLSILHKLWVRNIFSSSFFLGGKGGGCELGIEPRALGNIISNPLSSHLPSATYIALLKPNFPVHASQEKVTRLLVLCE